MFSTIRSIPKDALFFLKQLEKGRALRSYRSIDGAVSSQMKGFFSSGFKIVENIISQDTHAKLSDDYFIRAQCFSSTNSNISIPVLQKDFLKSIDYDSEALGYVKEYFRAFYRAEPHLQQVPKIIVTNPDIGHEEFDEARHRIPAFYHTDYPSELTIHIPLTEINEKTPRTLYLKGSHLSAAVRPMKKYTDCASLSSFEAVELFANPRDAIMIDVTGVHKAVLSASLRIMIQLKYTAGNDILNANANLEKMRASLNNANAHFQKFDVYSHKLKEDWQAMIESVDLTGKLKSELLSFKWQVHDYF